MSKESTRRVFSLPWREKVNEVKGGGLRRRGVHGILISFLGGNWEKLAIFRGGYGQKICLPRDGGFKIPYDFLLSKIFME